MYLSFFLQTISSGEAGEGKAQGWKRAMGGEALMTEGNIFDILGNIVKVIPVTRVSIMAGMKI